MQIAVVSGKGGTGKSSISGAFATLKSDVVLADCDVDAANLYLLFNPVCDEEFAFVSGQKAVIDANLCTNCEICIDYCRFDAISLKEGIVSIHDVLCDGCALCSRICPCNAVSMVNEDNSRMYSGYFNYGRMVYGRLAPGEENSGRLVNLVREKAKEVAKDSGFDTIIIDGPPGIGCPVISSVTGVDYVVIVTEPTISGLHDLMRTLQVIDHFNLKKGVIINKCDLNNRMTDEISLYCQERGVKILATLPFDESVVNAMVNLQSVVEWAPDSPISQSLSNVYTNILNLHD